MTTENQMELDRIRDALSNVLFHSTVMGGIRASRGVVYDYNRDDIEALRVYHRLFTIDRDPFPIIAVVRILQDHGGRHLLPELTVDHVRAYLAVNEAQQTQALHSGKRQSDSEMHNHRQTIMLVLEDLSVETAVCSIIVDRDIVDANEIKKLLSDMSAVQSSLSEGML